MFVVRAVESCADSFGQFVGAEQTVGLYHLTFAMNPLGLHSIEPRTLLGQQTTDDPHPFLLALFQSPVAPTDPAANLAAYVPTGVVPDQHQHLLAQSSELPAAPLKKLGGDGAHRTAVHKAQPRLLELGHIQPIARDGLRVGIIFFDRLLYKTQRLASFAKAVQVRLPHSAPPPSASVGRAAFFSFVQGVGRGDPVLGPLPAYSHTRKRRSYSLPANALFCESLLKTH